MKPINQDIKEELDKIISQLFIVKGERILSNKENVLRQLLILISQVKENTIEEARELIHKRKQEWHKDCLNDQFINGRFWEAQELWELLDSLKQK